MIYSFVPITNRGFWLS